jgi:hypothetical protein
VQTLSSGDTTGPTTAGEPPSMVCVFGLAS